MAIFCIPSQYVDKLKSSLASGKINFESLLDSTSKQRRELFASLTDQELGKFINVEFEKALVSRKKTALQDWAKQISQFKGKDNPNYKNLIRKISDLSDQDLLNPATEKTFLQDFVADKLGVTVSPEEVRVIDSMAKNVQEAQNKLGDNLGNPEFKQDNINFFEAKSKIDKYLQSKNPSPLTQIISSTIGRSAMLASAKSPILNISSNTLVGGMEALIKRLVTGRWKGTDNKLAADYMKMAWDIYQKTGYDITRMMTVDDAGVSGSTVVGDIVHSQGPGATRKVARVSEDIVFKQLMGAPDVAFAAAHFADTVNLLSHELAKGDKAYAKKIMKDAISFDPKTPEGKILRQQAILDAETATFTNKTWASQLSGHIRKGLNDLFPKYRLGDFIYPFVKTPANMVALGLDYAGGGAVKSLVKLSNAIISKKLDDPIVLKDIMTDAARSGVGFVAAWMLSQAVKDDDFEGPYNPNKRQEYELEGKMPNSFKLGNKYISTDYLGPLAVPFLAQMYARQYNGLKDRGFQYGKSLVTSAFEIPGIKESARSITELLRAANNPNIGVDDAISNIKSDLVSEAKSRLIPSFMGDIAKATDKYQRVSNKKALDPIKNVIPGLRQTLPIKTDVFGKPLETESAMTSILAGSRVKTAKSNKITEKLKEIEKQEGKRINFTDFDRAEGKKITSFKKAIGKDKYDLAKKDYGDDLTKALNKLISSKEFNNQPTYKQLKKLDSLDNDILEKTMRKYNFKYKPEKKK